MIQLAWSTSFTTSTFMYVIICGSTVTTTVWSSAATNTPRQTGMRAT